MIYIYVWINRTNKQKTLYKFLISIHLFPLFCFSINIRYIFCQKNEEKCILIIIIIIIIIDIDIFLRKLNILIPDKMLQCLLLKRNC